MGLLFGQESPSAGFLIPYAPPLDRWTEDHYLLFTLVELALGNRKELTPEEAADEELAAEVEGMIDSGEPGWLQKVMEHFDDLDDLTLDDDLFREIDTDQRRRGQ